MSPYTCGVDNPQAKCIVNGKCSKHFPKEYRERTDWAEDSYPLYARPDNGLVFECNGALLEVLSRAETSLGRTTRSKQCHTVAVDGPI